MKKDFTKANLLLTLFLTIVLGAGFYLIHRNNQTLKFRNELVFHIDDLRDIGYLEPCKVYYGETVDAVSYNKMFLSMKPLKTKSFFSEEIIAKYHLENL